jgi:hypothetical protein
MLHVVLPQFVVGLRLRQNNQEDMFRSAPKGLGELLVLLRAGRYVSLALFLTRGDDVQRNRLAFAFSLKPGKPCIDFVRGRRRRQPSAAKFLTHLGATQEPHQGHGPDQCAADSH